jgi:hypothetical protein
MKCPDCGQATGAPDWNAREYIMWRNQYGQKVRVFCYACGGWNDITQLNSRPDKIHRVRASTVTPAANE